MYSRYRITYYRIRIRIPIFPVWLVTITNTLLFSWLVIYVYITRAKVTLLVGNYGWVIMRVNS